MASKKKKTDIDVTIEHKENEVHFISSLKDILANTKNNSISLGSIMTQLKDEGLIFLIAIISFPTSLPIPTPPGFTTLFGIPLCILTIQMIYRLDYPWLPKWISKKTIQVTTFQTFISKAEPWFDKLTKFIKPRQPHLTTKSVEKLVGLLAFLCSISIALPILFGNAIPSAGIFIMSIGLLYKDGLTVLIGIIVSIAGLLIATTVVGIISYLGMEAFEKIISKISLT